MSEYRTQITFSRLARDPITWAKCGKCGHKLFRMVRGAMPQADCEIEMKCPSCRAFNSLGSPNKKEDKNT